MKRIILIVICICVMMNTGVFALEINPDRSTWFEWNMPDEELVKGTAIDMSFVLEKNAGSHGFASAKGEDIFFADGTVARFWGTNVCGEANFQTHENAEILADRIARSGYNMVRFHHLDAKWSSPNIFGNTSTTRKLNAEYLDRLFYFMYLLKERGVYFYVDTLVSRTQAASGDNITATEDLGQGWGIEAEFDPYLIQLQKEYISQLFTTVNPYTGLALCDDPALVFVDIQNENSLFSLTSGSLKTEYYRLQLEEKFNTWVKNKYASQAKLVEAWGSLDTGESYGSVHLYDDYKKRDYTSNRKNDVFNFLYDTTETFYNEMTSYMRDDIGIKCLITGLSIGGSEGVYSPASLHLLTKTGDFIDRHNYISHPKDWNFGNGTEFYDMTKSMTNSKGAGYLIYYPSMQRIYGKPYILSEWQECAPNRYRTEGPLLMSAYSCFQNWHALNFSLLTGNLPQEAKELVNPFDTFNDPLTTSNMSYASLIYLRGEVDEAESEYFVPYNKSSVMKYSLKEFHLDDRAVSAYGKTGVMFTDLVNNSSASSSTTLSNLKAKAAAKEAQNEQIKWDHSEGIFELRTDYTNAVTGFVNKRDISLDYAIFDMENEFASVALSSVTDKPLAQSDRLLLTTTARAENTGMTMSETGTALETRGTAPVLVEPVIGSITIKTTDEISVYALNSSGVRTKKLDVRTNNDGTKSFSVDGSYKAVCYEIIKGVNGLSAVYNEETNTVTVNGIVDNLNNEKAERITVTAMTGNYTLNDLTEDNAEKLIDFVKVILPDEYGRYRLEFNPGKLNWYGKRNIFLNILGEIITTNYELPDNSDFSYLPSNSCIISEAGWKEYNIYCGAIADGFSCKAVDNGILGYTSDNKLNIGITKAFSGVCFTEKNGFNITEKYVENGYICADISMENCYDKVRFSLVCYPSGTYKEYIGGTLDIKTFVKNADGTYHVTIPLKNFGVAVNHLGIIHELRIQAYGKGYSDIFSQSNPGYMCIDNVIINKYNDAKTNSVLWTAYDGGYTENVTGKPQSGVTQEIMADSTLKITSTSPTGIRFCNSDIISSINEFNKRETYIKFRLKKENMQTNTIRVIFWANEWWDAKEFGAWTVEIDDTQEWQEISVPMGSFASEYWNEIKGIRIDPYEPWDAETITSENPAVMYLDDIRVELDYTKELILKSGFFSDSEGKNSVESIQSGECVYSGLSYYNKLSENKNLSLIIAVYDIDGILRQCMVKEVPIPAFGSELCYGTVMSEYTPQSFGESIRIFVWNDINSNCMAIMDTSGIKEK